MNKIVVNKTKKIVLKNDKKIRFPKLQFEMIALMSENPGKVYTRDELMETLWRGAMSIERTVDVQVAHIRKQLGNKIIETITGYGYAWNEFDDGEL